MRLVLTMTSLVLLATLDVTFSQKQEEGLLERVTGVPDMELSNALQSKKFEGEGRLNLNQAAGSDRTAIEAKPIDARSYRETRSFLGIKNPWFGSKVVSTQPANLNSLTVPNAEKAFPTRTAAAKTSSDSGHTSPEATREVPTKPYLGKGSAQGALDPFSEAANRKLTVEDVRELLNKND